MNKRKMIIYTAVCTILVAAFIWYDSTLPTDPGTTSLPSGTTAGTSTDSPTSNPADLFPTPPHTIQAPTCGDINIVSLTANGYFYVNRAGEYQCTFLKGVNMGLTLPDTNLNNPNIPYLTYYQWFGQIAAMNANTVKIFTIMNPAFYNALYAYNKAHMDAPIYLLQGIWVSENDIYAIGDAYGEEQTMLNNFTRAVNECVDIIHGNSDYTSYGDLSPAVYDKDVSSYVVGYILGMEWPPEFIETTNTNHPDKSDYQGEYLHTEDATPFEAFLCNVGDFLISYETDTYHSQTPVAFLNWSTTDVLTHSNEPFPEEDSVSLNTNAIQPSSDYYAGLFAAVDAYPYYPEFMNYQQEYVDYVDEQGNPDPYRAYLRDLKTQYTIPLIVAEYGVPTSRGKAHSSVIGFDQGGLTEEQQGEMDSQMLSDIAKESYAGAMLFSWQDEWFKQVWNTVKYGAENTNARCLNVMSAEQEYGLLAFEPRQSGAIYPDGDLSEWAQDQPDYQSDAVDLYYKADEAYFYIMGNLKTGNLDNQKLAIAIGLTDHGSNFSAQYKIAFDKPTDFLLILDGKDNTRLLTDAYYDVFQYNYTIARTVFPINEQYSRQNSGIFNPILMFLSNEIVLPVDGKTLAPVSYESGKLLFGNANPNSDDYNSLADFNYSDCSFEIRIPWYLLNVANPAEKKKIADFYNADGISFDDFDGFNIGANLLDEGTTHINLSAYDFTGWQQSLYEMRLKRSYDYVAKAMETVMADYQ